MKRAEYRWAIWAAIGIIALSCIPYIVGYAAAPEGYHFLGFTANMDDAGVYLSWMRQAADGHFFLQNQFTTEPQSGRGFNLFFLLMGTFARFTHLPLAVVFHLVRIGAGLALLLTVYGLSAIWLEDIRLRRIALLIVGLSAGIGWVFQVDRPLSVDRWQPEAITFLSIYLSPLYTFPTLLMLGALYYLLRHAQTGAWKYALYAGLILLLLANVHTYDIITLATAWALYSAYRLARRDYRPMIGGLIAALIGAPSAGYQLYFYLIDPVFKARAAVPTPSPGPMWYLTGYGLLVPLAVYGIFEAVRNRKDVGLLVCWAAAGLIAVYLPISFQRKLIMGTHIPLSLLAAVGFVGLLNLTPQKLRNSLGLVLFLLMVPSNLIALSRDIVRVMTNEVTTAAHVPYASSDELAAFDYLRTHSRPGSLILAPPPTASLIPGFTGRPVYCGHWGETLDFRRKFWEVFAFYSARKTPEQRFEFLRRHGFSYVLSYHSTEDAHFVDLEAEPAPYLKPVFRRKELAVYKVSN